MCSVVVPFTLGMTACLMLNACTDYELKNENELTQEDKTLASSRTVLVYMVAENTLNPYATPDINEMLKGMNDATLRKGDKLLIYIDDIYLPRIYSVTKMSTPLTINQIEPVMRYDEDCNSASAEQLGKVVDYMTKHHSADSYGLVFWSHASGWIPSTYAGDKTRAFGVDNGINNESVNKGNQMEITDMAKALNGRCHFDYIFFDACNMQSIEVDYELRECADYIVSSPAEIPGPGADYSLMMKPLFRENGAANDIVQTYFNTYFNSNTGTMNYVGGFQYGLIVSAVNTQELSAFASYMQSICATHKEQMTQVNPNRILNYMNYMLFDNTKMPDYMDIQGIMMSVLDEDEFKEWKERFSKVVPINRYTSEWTSNHVQNTHVDPAQCGGVSMFVPLRNRYSQSRDGFVDSIRDTEWGQIMWGNY